MTVPEIKDSVDVGSSPSERKVYHAPRPNNSTKRPVFFNTE